MSTKHHWIEMSEDGTLPPTTLMTIEFEAPLVQPHSLTITADRASFSQLTSAQAAQLITSLQEDYEAKS